jgi:Xaa-Pro aminopeptidase
MSVAEKIATSAPAIPFDVRKLDELMEEAGIDMVIATSKHAVQYLLGGHRSCFFDVMDAIGSSRYLPVLAYPKGKPDKAIYVGSRLESYQVENRPLWVPEVQTTTRGSVDAINRVIPEISRLGLKPRRIGVEMGFLPADAHAALTAAFPDAELVDGLFVLERLRAVKTPEELRKLKLASELVTDAMLAVMEQHAPGKTTRELTEALRREETNRGLTFEYCLITAGTSLNRAPSERRWEKGDILSLDSGGNYQGYIGDLCRMAILGEPDAELQDFLAEITDIQHATMAIVKAGARGGDVYATAEKLMAKSRNHNHMHFLAHGMGLVSHEVPRLYEARDAERPLEAGMVVSIETTLEHPRRGFVKLEDTVAVTQTGYEIYGERARGWNRGGTRVAQ